MLARSARPFTVETTASPAGPFGGASHVISSLRVGGLAGRIIDEQVPLAYGVVGQETTGPGGWAMALRTIPAIVDLTAQVRRAAQDAWIINFTNPAGLITQALMASGERRVIGICDTPPALGRRIAAQLGLPETAMRLDYLGLNHLGWVRAIWDGRADRLPEILASDDAIRGVYGRPPPAVIEAMGTPDGRELIVTPANGGAITDLDGADAVEIPFNLGPSGPRPRRMGSLPAPVRDLVLRVKAYERATIAAALNRSWRDAVAALAMHPLVPSAEIAAKIAAEYRRRHTPHLDYLR